MCSPDVVAAGSRMSPQGGGALHDIDDVDSCDDFMCKSLDGTFDGSIDPAIEQEFQRWLQQPSPAAATLATTAASVPETADHTSGPSLGVASGKKQGLKIEEFDVASMPPTKEQHQQDPQQTQSPDNLDTVRTIASCQSEPTFEFFQMSFTNSRICVEFCEPSCHESDDKQSQQQATKACDDAPPKAALQEDASQDVAAIRLQSAERGRKARQEVRTKRSDERKKQLRAEMEASAATRVQSAQRGRIARQEVAKRRDEIMSCCLDTNLKNGEAVQKKTTEVTVDLNDVTRQCPSQDLAAHTEKDTKPVFLSAIETGLPQEGQDVSSVGFQDFQQFFELTAQMDTQIGRLLAQIQEAEEEMRWKDQIQADIQARIDQVELETSNVDSAFEMTVTRLQEEVSRGEQLRSSLNRVSAEVEGKTVELRHLQLEKDSMLLNGMPFNGAAHARLPLSTQPQKSPKQKMQLPPLPHDAARVRAKTFSLDPTLERSQNPAIEGVWMEVGKLGERDRAEIVRRLQSELTDQDGTSGPFGNFSVGSQDRMPLCGSAARALRSVRGTNQE